MPTRVSMSFHQPCGQNAVFLSGETSTATAGGFTSGAAAGGVDSAMFIWFGLRHWA
jgi:hypothetical protein